MPARLWGVLPGTRHDHVTGHGDAGPMLAEILARGAPGPNDICVDLGAGAGFLTLPLAEMVRGVIAVDDYETPRAGRADGAEDRVRPHIAALTSLILPYDSVDLVVSGYALHHLHHADKRAILARAHRWLRPGGRIVIGDLMYEPDSGRRAGRLRHALRIGAGRPATPQFWLKALTDAGFVNIGHTAVSPRSGVAWGTCDRSADEMPIGDAAARADPGRPHEPGRRPNRASAAAPVRGRHIRGAQLVDAWIGRTFRAYEPAVMRGPAPRRCRLLNDADVLDLLEAGVGEQVGINLPHYTGSQYNMGSRISSRDQARPGDILFFYPDLGYNGMYIGNGKMVHAPRSGKTVEVVDLAPYYWSTFVGGSRILS